MALNLNAPPLTDDEILRELRKDSRVAGLFAVVMGSAFAALVVALWCFGMYAWRWSICVFFIGTIAAVAGVLALVRPQSYLRHAELITSVHLDGLRPDQITVNMADGKTISVSTGGFDRARLVTAIEGRIARARAGQR